ncbi:MAG: lysophospholipase [Holophagales bacterium]|nr:lysophospholipase [Holophagales bacterium]
MGPLAYDLERPAGPTLQASTADLCVLYCHGFASRRAGRKAAFFRRRFLARGVAFCAFDFRGHGDSDGRLFDLGLSRNLEDVASMHAHLAGAGFRRLILFGSSMGGGTCTWYATRHPEEVTAAIHIAPSLEMEKGLLRRLTPGEVERWQREGTLLFEHELGAHELSWQVIEDLRSYDRHQLGPAYRTPTLIFQGLRDDSVSWRSTVGFAASCEQAEVELHLMTDADHRLLDRLPHLWRLAEAFLIRRGLIEGCGEDREGERADG